MKNSAWDLCLILSISWITEACTSDVVLSCCWASTTVRLCLCKYLNFCRLWKFREIFPLWGSIAYKIKCYVLSGLLWRWQHLIAASYFSSSGSGFIYFCFPGPFRPADLKWWLLHANGIKYLSQTAARERTLGINCWPRGKSQNKGSAAVLTNASLYFKKSLVAIPLLNSPGSFLMWNRALAAFQPDLVLLLPLLIHPGASHFCIPLVLEWRNGEQEGDLEQRVRDRKATTKSLIHVGKIPA